MNSAHHPTDHRWMHYALALAARGQGFVEPNPMVGCVIVRDDVPLAEGYHRKFGGPHAERDALANLAQGCDPAGATWYVTLEPCCHTGKTPPCTDAVVAARPARIVVATEDPFAEVAGRGIDQLRAAGIDVAVGVCSDSAKRLNAPYFKRVQQQSPWVIAKWAMTLDGKIASCTGDSKWISGESSRRRVHQLRARVDAIVTGIGTVLADDPTLTARPPGQRIATRIVMDQRAELPVDSKLIGTLQGAPLVAVVGPDAAPTRVDRLGELGCGIIACETTDRSAMVQHVLRWCYEQGMTNLMIEAGAGVLATFLEAGAIDEYQVYIAAKVIGGRNAFSPIAGLGLEQIAQSPRLEPLQAESLDGDLLITTRTR